MATQAQKDRYIKAVWFPARRLGFKYKISPALAMAQGALESNYGTSQLATNAKNLFGIKANTGWQGSTYGAYRAYPAYINSIKNYYQFLTENSRYKKAGLFKSDKWRPQLDSIVAAGYAEDRNYKAKVVAIMDEVIDTASRLKREGKLINWKLYGGLGLLAFGAYGLYLRNKKKRKTK